MRKILVGGVLTGFAFASFLYTGCGGDDTAGPGGADGGRDVTSADTGGGQDTAPPDVEVSDSGGGDTNPPPPNGKLIVVHASPDAPALRFCYGVGTKDDGSDTAVVGSFTAAPDTVRPGQPYPGLFAGTGGVLPDTGVNLANLALTPFVISAALPLMAGETADAGPDGGKEDTCTQLVGANGKGGILQPGTGFIQFPTIPTKTVLPATTTLIAAVGCLPTAQDTSASTTRCGADYNATTGNLKLLLFKLDRTAIAGKIGVQVAHAASAWDGVLGAAAQVTAILQPDGGPLDLINPPDAGLQFGKLLPAPASSVATADLSPSNIFAVTTVAANGTTVNTLPLPLGIVAKLTNGTGVSADGGAYFTDGQNYAFLLLGDPSAEQLVLPDGGPNPAYAGYGLHVVAFPTDPDLPTTF
jgi:hypothetical protein